MTLTVHSVTFDSGDAGRLARFWAEALRLELADGATASSAVVNGDGTRLLFLAVPEAKAVKNRVHLDLRADDREAEVERLLQLGATRLDDLEEDGDRWTVLADPEGNEFCVVQVR